MNLDEAKKIACKEKTLIDALTWIAVWEADRAIALKHNKTGVSTASCGKYYDTCFKMCFEAVMLQWRTKIEEIEAENIRQWQKENIADINGRYGEMW